MRTLIAFIAVIAVAGLSAGLATASSQSKATLTVGKSSYGTILFDGKGRALYGFTRDRRGKPSRCYGDCAAAWPVYYKAGALKAGKGVKQSLIGTTRRKDGRLQVTYNGWPLYRYIHDVKAGQVSCQNVSQFGGLWLVVAPSGKLVR